ncbi:MAG: alpha/beta fold hydrolase [Pseudomonadota bacterium]
MDVIRTPDSAFEALADFSYEPHYHHWHDLRMHYVDEGPRDGPVMLLLHGMPTWAYLYRTMIPALVAAGYRCIAPDHVGFGRSDKPADTRWYSIARHIEVLTSLIADNDLNDITLICQDWGGPIGLAQAAMMPERFARLTIMNTWLHHDAFVYPEAAGRWIKHWQPGGLFDRPCPNVAALLLLSGGFVSQKEMIAMIVDDREPDPGRAGASMYAAYAAPHRGLDDAAYSGLRRFPLSIPHRNGIAANGAAQTFHYRTLLGWTKPAHFIWGGADDIFSEQWGREWASQMPRTTFDVIPDAGHFLQNTHGPEVVAHLLGRIAAE